MTREVVQVVYADDPDAHAVFEVTDAADGDLDWADPKVAVGAADYELDAEWLGDPGTPRQIKVPVPDVEPRTTPYTLYLQVPGGNDFPLGRVSIKAR